MEFEDERGRDAIDIRYYSNNPDEDDIIPLCAAFATRENGNARRAIKLLRKAAHNAESEACERKDVDRVTEDHVRVTQREIEADTVSEGTKNLREQACYLLVTVASIEARGGDRRGNPDRLRDVRSDPARTWVKAVVAERSAQQSPHDGGLDDTELTAATGLVSIPTKVKSPEDGDPLHP